MKLFVKPVVVFLLSIGLFYVGTPTFASTGDPYTSPPPKSSVQSTPTPQDTPTPDTTTNSILKKILPSVSANESAPNKTTFNTLIKGLLALLMINLGRFWNLLLILIIFFLLFLLSRRRREESPQNISQK